MIFFRQTRNSNIIKGTRIGKPVLNTRLSLIHISQFSQYFARFDRGTKAAPHSTQCFTPCPIISAWSALSAGNTAFKNHRHNSE